ncbi:hypothetical protein ES703_06915 [subsurface metagenome]
MKSIAVLMPTKNSAKWLDEVLAPIVAQKSEYDIKLVLVDGYSTDGTEFKAMDYFPNLVIVHDISRNLATARNICLVEGRKLKTDYMAFIDSDIVVPLDFFKRMIRHLDNPQVVISALRFELEHDPAKYFVGKYYRNRTDIARSGIAKTDYTGTACVMWKSPQSRGVVLDERLKRAGEDVDFILQLTEKGNYYAIVDSDEPHAIHIRPATIREELHRVKDHGMARALLMKLHRKSLDPGRYKKTVLAGVLTTLGWIGLVLALLFKVFWPIGLVPFFIIFLRQWMKTRDKGRLDYVFFGFLLSTIYFTRFTQGVIKYWT